MHVMFWKGGGITLLGGSQRVHLCSSVDGSRSWRYQECDRTRIRPWMTGNITDVNWPCRTVVFCRRSSVFLFSNIAFWCQKQLEINLNTAMTIPTGPYFFQTLKAVGCQPQPMVLWRQGLHVVLVVILSLGLHSPGIQRHQDDSKCKYN